MKRNIIISIILLALIALAMIFFYGAKEDFKEQEKSIGEFYQEQIDDGEITELDENIIEENPDLTQFDDETIIAE